MLSRGGMPRTSVERGARVKLPGCLPRFSGGSDPWVPLSWSIVFSLFEERDCITGMSARMGQALRLGVNCSDWVKLGLIDETERLDQKLGALDHILAGESIFHRS